MLFVKIIKSWCVSTHWDVWVIGLRVELFLAQNFILRFTQLESFRFFILVSHRRFLLSLVFEPIKKEWRCSVLRTAIKSSAKHCRLNRRPCLTARTFLKALLVLNCA